MADLNALELIVGEDQQERAANSGKISAFKNLLNQTHSKSRCQCGKKRPTVQALASRPRLMLAERIGQFCNRTDGRRY